MKINPDLFLKIGFRIRPIGIRHVIFFAFISALLSILPSFLFAQNLPAYLPSNGLVGWWPFNGNANDESGNGNHGTVNGATLTSDRYGNAGRAYSFNGTSNAISIPHSSVISLSVPSTMSFWFRIPSYPQDGKEHYFFSKFSGGPGAGMKGIHMAISNWGNSNVLFIRYRNGEISEWGQIGLPYSFLPAAGNWFHLVFSCDDVSNRAYVNGLLVNTSSPTTIMGSNSANLLIGNGQIWDESSTAGFQGILDDIAIWNRALTQSEITKMYQAGLQYSISTQRDGNCAGGPVNLTAATAVSLSTTAASTITNNSTISGGSIINDGGQTITQRGVCWSTSPNPTIALSTKTSDGSGSGTFSSNLSGLSASTTYFVRAYATTASGTWYGDEKSFTTLAPVITVTDIDGNVYNTVTIGTQTWMKENLKVSKYRNGDAIPTNLSDSQWATTSIGACAIYNNFASNNETYGKLYNWYAVVDNRNICPIGWHLPTKSEWLILENYLGGSSVAGGKLKSTTTHWFAPNIGATNESGFSGLPCGLRKDGGLYDLIRDNGYWWSFTEDPPNNAWDFRLQSSMDDSFLVSNFKRFGFSVRCLKN
jgi:uncharacterized protein (TIGR02145 family)